MSVYNTTRTVLVLSNAEVPHKTRSFRKTRVYFTEPGKSGVVDPPSLRKRCHTLDLLRHFVQFHAAFVVKATRVLQLSEDMLLSLILCCGPLEEAEYEGEIVLYIRSFTT